MRTDETLYELYWQGEEKAADELVLRHGDILTLYINGYLKDMHEAEDLMIETFALMFARRRPVSGEGSFRAYLYRTARNLAGKTKKSIVYYILDWKLCHLKFRAENFRRPDCLTANETVSCTWHLKN